jgi:membrane-associated protease RseP (regulator of RpoE activity)
MIEYRFNLLDSYVDTSGLATFTVVQEQVKEKFQELLHDLANHNLMASIQKVADKLVISVFPKPKLSQPRKAVNLALFLATVATVSLASYFYITAIDPRVSTILFTGSGASQQMMVFAISILGIVGLHETGHLLAVRHHKMDATLPYFVPAPPPIGTFGAMISLRGAPANRDQLFDLGFSGPIAGFMATLAVGIFMIVTAPVVSAAQLEGLMAEKLLESAAWPNVPLLVELIQQAGLRTPSPGYVMVLPSVFFAVQVGALITFLNLLPVWQLDGGHISRATLGDRGHRFGALLGFAVLIAAGFWPFALLLIIFMFASRRPLQGVIPLDDISPLSNSRRILFGASLVILGLSFVIL